MKKHFQVIGNTNGEKFNKTLADYCKDGYEPHGSLIVTAIDDKYFLCQMMVKEMK